MWNDTPLTRLLGIDYPIVHGAFGGQGPCIELAARVSSSGGLGSFGMHQLDGDQIRRTVRAIRSRTSRPFAANLWIPKDDSSSRNTPGLEGLAIPDLADQLHAVLEARPPVFSFVYGRPSDRVLALCRERGILTIGSAVSADEASALERAGVDCIVASGWEEGAHAGQVMRPRWELMTSTLALLPQLVGRVRLPVIAAGGIADARGVAAALALGAHGVQLGAEFLARPDAALGRPYRARSFGGRRTRSPGSQIVDEFIDAISAVHKDVQSG